MEQQLGLLPLLRSALIDIGSLLLPPACIRCDRTLRSGLLCLRCQPPPPYSQRGRCIQCFSRLSLPARHDQCELCEIMPLPSTTMRYAWDYHGEIAILISIMKYRPLPALAHALASAILPACDEAIWRHSIDSIVPMPSSLDSLRSRGFNQCALIAKHMSTRLARPVSLTALTHSGTRKRQASLSPDERFKNVRGAFTARSDEVQNRSVLLIDDVITTGATIGQACSALLEAGAQQVHVFTLARAGTWTEHRDAAAQALLRQER